MEKPDMERRALVTGLLAAAALPRTLHGAQDPEVPTYWAEVPARATLWALVVFTADEPVEVTVAAGKEIKALRGRFDGTRMAEYSWHNRSDGIARIAIRARALAGDRELPAARVQYLSEQNLYLAFGRRATPAHASDRRGGYPYEAVFVGFLIFGE